LPEKNVRLLDGKPLIAWSIEQALLVHRIERVIVSTDSEEIASIARQYGAETPFIRPASLARDDSPEWMAWRHALQFLQQEERRLPDVMVSVPTTSPLRSPQDIENCLDEFEKGEADVVITVAEARRSPYFNMIKKSKEGDVTLVIPSEEGINRRQDAQKVYDITTVAYAAKPEFVMSNTGIFQGRVRAVEVPQERALDIDNAFDFRLAECLVRMRR
jgi:N-acylneuraminate cytidylyltransferase